MGEVVARMGEKLLRVLEEDPMSNLSSDLFGLENLMIIKQYKRCGSHCQGRLDIEMITERLGKLKHEFNVEAIVVVTEKDYDRNPVILKQLYCLKVLVLCSSLQIMPPLSARTKESFRMNLKKHLIDSLQEKKKK
ncbi:hypothetical protein COCNU_14G008000 [Cocos nucifera]|uniref:Uncharacterized protein n=1 Tax=Cocos nucifera TaxID=13894 RepID=A0A8K0IVA7_COCNU|nr:hypothetical protein COCNU_14G008000 [Cocos nucifera]